jgi:adenylate kinase
MSALLGKAAGESTPIGRSIREHMAGGELVSLEDALKLLRSRLEKPDAAKGFILDGFPRTVEQARALDGLLAEKKLGVSAAVLLGIPRRVSVARALERLSCPRCNLTFTGEMLSGSKRCQKCGRRLVKRVDRSARLAEKRTQEALQHLRAMNTYYRERGRLIVVDARRNRGADIAGHVKGIKQQLRAKRPKRRFIR